MNLPQTIQKLTNGIEFNESVIDILKIPSLNKAVNNATELYKLNSLEHIPILYDLYKFMGVTSTNDPAYAVPANLYELVGNAYMFKLPIWGYRVPYGENPQTITGGSPWQFVTTITIIKTKVHYLNLTDLLVKKSKIVSYLSTDGNVGLPPFNVTIDPINELSTDFATFYRWIKVTDGYELEYYSFFPFSNDVNVTLNTSVYFLDKDLGNEIQSFIF